AAGHRICPETYFFQQCDANSEVECSRASVGAMAQQVAREPITTLPATQRPAVSGVNRLNGASMVIALGPVVSAYATEGENQTRGNPSLVDHRMVRFLDADQARRDLRRGGYRVDALRLCCTTFASRLLFFLPVLLASITFSEVTLRTTFPE